MKIEPYDSDSTKSEATLEALQKLAGSWEDDRTAEEIIAEIQESRRRGSRPPGSYPILD